MLAAELAVAQVQPGERPQPLGPRGRPAVDSLPTVGGALTGPVLRSSNLDSIRISPDALEEQVDYSAADSMYTTTRWQPPSR